MKIEFKNKKIEKLCTNLKYAEKTIGTANAVKLKMRLDILSAYENIEALLQRRVGGCHKLSGNRKNQYAMSLAEPFRLIFEIQTTAEDIVIVIEIIDYHKR